MCDATKHNTSTPHPLASRNLTQSEVHADLDSVLQAFPADKQQEALQEIQTRITNVMFVELLFEKGPREAEMINREYNWQPAVQRKMADLGYRDTVQQGTATHPHAASPFS